MKTGRAAPLIGALAAACCGSEPVVATGTWGGSLVATSDYVYQGVSQTGGMAAYQADLHYGFTGAQGTWETFVGLWGSTLNRQASGGANAELDAYLGRTLLLEGSNNVTFTYSHYAYPGDEGPRRYDYDELATMWSYQDQLFATVAWTPDTAGYSEAGYSRCCRKLAYNLELHEPLTSALTWSVGIGWDEFARAPGYAFWNSGFAYAFRRFQIDVSYFSTQPRIYQLYGSTVAGPRWAATIAWRF